MLPHIHIPMLTMQSSSSSGGGAFVAKKFVRPGMGQFSTVDWNNGTLIAGASNGLIARTTDGGTTFTETSLVPNWTTVTGWVGSFFTGRWLVYGANGAQALSTDDGVTWTVTTISGSPMIRESRMFGNFWWVCGDSGYASSAVDGNQGGAFTYPNNSYSNTSMMFDSSNNVIFSSTTNSSFYFMQTSNPSINGFFNIGKGNSLHSWSNGSLCAVTHVDGSVSRFATIAGPVSNSFIPSAILTDGVTSGQKIPVKIWHCLQRNEWVVVGNAQGAPNPLIATSPDLINWTNRATGVSDANLVGNVNDVTWDNVNQKYVFACTAKNSGVDGGIILYFTP